MFEDKVTEDEEVEDEIEREQRQQHQPVGFRLSRQDAVEDQVDKSAGEGRTDTDLQDMA